MQLRFDGRVVLITGAGNGIGREYALEFARRGAKVVVNDLGVNQDGVGTSSNAADAVVDEIRAFGGDAVASYDSVEQGEKIVQTALNTYGRIDVLVNNAGALRDVSFSKITTPQWDAIVDINMKGPFLLSKAAWGAMKKQKFGRILYTTSGSGLYGQFGQANYSAAKMSLTGLSATLAKEGAKYNINANAIAPMAFTRMTRDVIPVEAVDAFPPRKVVPIGIWLSHESCKDSGSIFEVGGGLYTRVRIQRSKGLLIEAEHSAEAVKEGWQLVQDFSEADYPELNNEIIIKRVSMANKTSLDLERITPKL
jgi:3-hydroxyacyl-CoA dehydrogenase/3a,7a,12a-trihydroxy-5b-cholest-24-enoyl-CoA hydratase